jgi:hypothetical protein
VKVHGCSPHACSVLSPLMASVTIMPLKPSMASLRWKGGGGSSSKNSRQHISTQPACGNTCCATLAFANQLV